MKNSRIVFIARSISTFFMALSMLFLPGSVAIGQGQTETVVKKGDAAPDGNGLFDRFTPASGSDFNKGAVINDAGDIAFLADLADTIGGTLDGVGVFRASNGAIAQIARTGQAPPDGNGTFHPLGFANTPFIDNVGQVGFVAAVDGASTNPNHGFFRGSGGILTQIVRTGQAAPDGNGTFGLFANSPFSRINEFGEIAFRGGVVDTPGGIGGGIFRGSGGALTQIIGVGQSAPDGNGTFSTMGRPAINDAGQTACWVLIAGSSGNGSSDSGVFLGSGSTISQIVRTGRAAPDGNGTLEWFYLSQIAINDSGQTVFNGLLSGTAGGAADDSGIFRGNGQGNLAIVAREGQVAPDGNGVFGDMYRGTMPKINNAGQTAFINVLTGTSGSGNVNAPDTRGVFRESEGVITQIARGGQTNVDGSEIFSSFSDLVMHESGQMAFIGNSISNVNRVLSSLFVGDGVDLIQVAQTRETLAGSYIRQLEISDSPINSSGQIAYTATLGNGDQLIQLWTPDLNWRATTGGDWSDSNNWTLGLTPGAVHNVSLDSDLDVSINVPTNVNVGSLQFGGGIGLTTVNMQAGGSLSTSTGLNVLSNGTLTGTGNVSSTVNNSGTIEAENLIFTSAITNSDTGTINIGDGANVTVDGDLVQNGSLNIPANATTSVRGTYSGSGGFRGWGRFFARGRLRIGNSPASVLMEGDLILENTTESEFEFAGEDVGDFDQLVVGGNLTLDGELTIVELDGFGFGSGQEFIIADVGNLLTGQFTGLNEGDLVGNFSGTDLFISYTAGDGNDVSLFTAAAVPLLGDVNLDSAVDFLDISPFISILSGGGFQAEADCDENGVVDFLDISPFIATLSGS